MAFRHEVLRLRPLQYAHITDESNNTTRLVVGPLTHPLSATETVSKDVTAFHVVPRGSYARVENPWARVVNSKTGQEEPLLDVLGQVVVRSGEVEVRYDVPAFPLYPEERLLEICPLLVLLRDEALLLRALRTFSETDSDGHVKTRREYERFLFYGPGTYYPRVEVEVKERRKGVLVSKGEALHCRALEECVDGEGHTRSTGEEYLYMTPGVHIALPSEEILGTVQPMVLGNTQVLHVEVTKDYVDSREFARGVHRRAGDVFVVTGEMAPAFLPYPHDTIVKETELIHVSSHEYCIVRDPVDQNGVQDFGARKIYTNTSFYLKPGESLECEKRQLHLLTDKEALVLIALEDFLDNDVSPAVQRSRGEQWLLCGPQKWIPNRHVTVVVDPNNNREVRELIVLCEAEGIYVRNKTTGVVRSVLGPTTYMLKANEELWEKPLLPLVERCVRAQQNSLTTSVYDKEKEEGNIILTGKSSRVIVYHIPHRSVSLLYNERTQSTRTVFGPDCILLEPHEAFTVVSLSGSPWNRWQPTQYLPKEPGRIQALYLYLGPSNMCDIVHVETRDHAQLDLLMCYEWYFDIKKGDAEAARLCFSVNDFVGDVCNYIASRIRAALTSLRFEEFHTRSTEILTDAVFGVQGRGTCGKKELRFTVNNLVITSVDIQEMTVVDARTRQGLQKSAKMAIEMTTHAQEAHAHQVAMTREQAARGLLERQKINDQVENETMRKTLMEAESQGLTITNSAKMTSVAEAMHSAREIEGNAAVEAARIRAEKECLANNLIAEMEGRKSLLEMTHAAQMADIEQAHQAAMDNIQSDLMSKIVAALGPATIAEMAKAGPELQAKLLNGLGLEGYLVTDGTAPINLFRTANSFASSPSATVV